MRVILIFLFSLYLFADTNSTKTKDRIKTKVEFSFQDVSGNSERRTLRTKIKSEKKVGDKTFYIKAKALYSRYNDSTNEDKTDIKFKGRDFFSPKLFGFLEMQYLKDELAGYDYRLSFGPGLGYKFRKKKHKLETSLSILFAKDKFTNYIKEDYRSIQTSIDYNWRLSKRVTFYQDFSYEVSFKNRDKYFIDSESGFDIQLTERFSLGIRYKIEYKNIILETIKSKIDKSFFSALIVTF